MNKPNVKIAKRALWLRTVLLSGIGLAVVLVSLSSHDMAVGDPEDSGNGAPTDSTIADTDGNVYRTVTIGTQVWMVENLKVTRYRDGREIPNIMDDTVWSTLTNGAYCWCNNDSTNKDIYGALYNFRAVIDSCGLCPEGWRVPTDSEWLELVAYLGGESVAGGKMKEDGIDHWSSPNIGATNESGFSGLPGGGRGQITGSGEIGEYATWWSSTPYDSLYAWHWGLSRGNARVRFNPGHKASGFSVRCIRD
jgi:uncharacterized protein (TIGR02145 family)